MLNIILHDIDGVRENLLPLTFTRPAAGIRCGIVTIAEKWAALLPGHYSYATVGELAELYPATETPDSLHIAGHIIPTPDMARAVAALKPGQALMYNNSPAAWRNPDPGHTAGPEQLPCPEPVGVLNRLYDIFTLNGEAIKADFRLLTAGTPGTPLPDSCTLIGPENDLYIAPDANVAGAIINTTAGPVYIGPEAEVMEGSCLRGPIAVCSHATVNMGTKIYGATTIGPHCKAGGELNNVVMLGYSNKAHDGFLGNAVIGEWCNLGAGCTASNLKNDYTEIKLWNYAARRFLRTGLQFCGLIMGDHSKAGINTMFNTATVVGVGVNIHGTGFPRNFVASFSEGSAGAGFSDVPLDKFLSIAERVMARRNVTLTEPMKRLYAALHQITETYK